MIGKIDDGRSLTCDDIAYLFPGVDECPACIPVDGPCQLTFAERAGMEDTHWLACHISNIGPQLYGLLCLALADVDTLKTIFGTRDTLKRCRVRPQVN